MVAACREKRWRVAGRILGATRKQVSRTAWLGFLRPLLLPCERFALHYTHHLQSSLRSAHHLSISRFPLLFHVSQPSPQLFLCRAPRSTDLQPRTGRYFVALLALRACANAPYTRDLPSSTLQVGITALILHGKGNPRHNEWDGPSVTPGSSIYWCLYSRASMPSEPSEPARRTRLTSTMKSLGRAELKEVPFPEIDEGYSSLSSTNIDSYRSVILFGP